MSKELLDALSVPFPQAAIKQRPGGGGKALSYVEAHTVIHRLNDATGGTWDLKIIALDWRPDLLVATVEMTIPGLGTRQHIGIQEVKGNSSDLVKGAVSDAIKKVSTLFGVGLELYGPDFCEEAKPPPPQPPPPPDPRFSLLDALYEQAKLHGIEDLVTAGDYKGLSKFAGTICRSVGRESLKSLTTDDITTAIANVAIWAEYQRKPIVAAPTHPEDNLPELNAAVPVGGALFEVPAPSVVVEGGYADMEAVANRGGKAEPQGGKRKVSGDAALL